MLPCSGKASIFSSRRLREMWQYEATQEGKGGRQAGGVGQGREELECHTVCQKPTVYSPSRFRRNFTPVGNISTTWSQTFEYLSEVWVWSMTNRILRVDIGLALIERRCRGALYISAHDQCWERSIVGEMRLCRTEALPGTRGLRCVVYYAWFAVSDETFTVMLLQA